jgi:hypothetical protein
VVYFLIFVQFSGRGTIKDIPAAAAPADTVSLTSGRQSPPRVPDIAPNRVRVPPAGSPAAGDLVE